MDFDDDDWGDDTDDGWGGDDENEVGGEEGEDDGFWGRRKRELPTEEKDMSRVRRESVEKWRKGTLTIVSIVPITSSILTAPVDKG